MYSNEDLEVAIKVIELGKMIESSPKEVQECIESLRSECVELKRTVESLKNNLSEAKKENNRYRKSLLDIHEISDEGDMTCTIRHYK